MIIQGKKKLMKFLLKLRWKKLYNISIIAGKGTVALEIIEQVPNLDAIIVPTGGGGLLAGIAVTIKEMNPDIMIIVIELKVEKNKL